MSNTTLAALVATYQKAQEIYVTRRPGSVTEAAERRMERTLAQAEKQGLLAEFVAAVI